MTRWMRFALRYLASVAGCIYLLTIGWARADHREILHELLFRLGWRKRAAPEPDGPPLDIPQIEARALIPNPPPVRVLEQDAIDGNVSGFELLLITQLVKSRGAATVFEIGTFDGRTALNLAANVAEVGHVYTLDLPPENLDRTGLKIACGDENFIRKKRPGARFADTPYAAQITQLFGDSATFDFSPYEGKMDVVFVDGSHSYDYVRNDTEIALRLIKPTGGMIVWHDYGSRWWKDLTRAMNELYREIPEFRTMRHIRDTTLVVWEGKAEINRNKRERDNRSVPARHGEG